MVGEVVRGSGRWGCVPAGDEAGGSGGSSCLLPELLQLGACLPDVLAFSRLATAAGTWWSPCPWCWLSSPGNCCWSLAPWSAGAVAQGLGHLGPCWQAGVAAWGGGELGNPSAGSSPLTPLTTSSTSQFTWYFCTFSMHSTFRTCDSLWLLINLWSVSPRRAGPHGPVH